MNVFDNIFNRLRVDVEQVVKAAYPDLPAEALARMTVEPPRDATHGDMATNAAMVLSKPLGKNPREVAESIATGLRALDGIAAVDIAGPGFINITLAPALWLEQVQGALKAGTAYGQSAIGAGIKTNVEYVSANPTGPIHFGHTRNAVFGDALARLLSKAGFAVTREYYTNDAGAQVDTLARSVHIRYLQARGKHEGEIPAGLYPGDYLVPVAEQLSREFGDRFVNAPEDEWKPLFKARAIDDMMALIKQDLALIDVKHDVFTSEKHLTDIGNVDRAVQKLEDMGLVYTGVLPPPKSKKVNLDDWEPTELLLFKSSQFGDDQDRALKKSDGSWTYATPDMAYQYDKYLRGFEKLIIVVAVDHAGWVSRIRAGTRAVTDNKADVTVELYGLVNLMKNGEPFKLSKRAGNILTLREIVEEVGAGAVRFIMLTRKAMEPLDFDMSKALEQSKDNPYFYVQYAHARCCSVMKHAAGMFTGHDIADHHLAGVDLSSLTAPEEQALIKLLATWPRLVEQAAAAHEPHRVAFFLSDIAAGFHALWNKGRDDAAMRFLIEDNRDLTLARLALVRMTAIVIASALGVIGVEPLTELRSDVELEAA